MLNSSRWLRRCPTWLLVPGLALAITAAALLLVSLVVASFAVHSLLTRRGSVDPARMNDLGQAMGERLGPATSLALAFLVARWLVAERRVGQGACLALAACLTALGVSIDWLLEDPPQAGEAAVGLVFVGATVLGGWLGQRDARDADLRRRFSEELAATGSPEAVARALATYLGPHRQVDVFVQERSALRWLAGSTGAAPARTPPAEDLVRCGSAGHAAAVHGSGRPQRRLQGVADAVGVQLQRLALRAEGESAGALAERERLAGDIHDTMAQSLAAVTTHLEAAVSALARRAADAERHIQEALTSARIALAELRGLVWALRPAADRLSLAQALRQCVDRAALESGLSIELTSESPGVELSPEVELCLLRATQEGLRNAVRHGAPRSIKVALARAEDRIVLTIEDDGAGFVPAGAPPSGPDHGLGLWAMSRRVGRLGGEQEIVSSPGRGARLVLRLPRAPREGLRS